MFSRFARDAFESAGVTPFNLCPQTDAIPLNISVAMLTPGDRTFCSYSDGFPVTDTVLEQVYADSKGASICAMDPSIPGSLPAAASGGNSSDAGYWLGR